MLCTLRKQKKTIEKLSSNFAVNNQSPPHRNRRCGARAESKFICAMPSREEKDEVRGI